MAEKFNPAGLYEPQLLYFNAVRVSAEQETIYSSGIVGFEEDGNLPKDQALQIEQAWKNVAAFLTGCGLSANDLVRLKIHLTDRGLIPISREARIRNLGEHMNAAVTGVIVELFDPDLCIEIDIVAARSGTGH